MVYRHMSSQCVSCGRALESFSIDGHSYEICRDCNAVFVDERTLQAMWQEMSGAPQLPPLEERQGGARVRGCPKCGEPMRRVQLLIVPVDVCPMHGVWFDRHELETALAGAALPLDDWLRMFAEKLRAMR